MPDRWIAFRTGRCWWCGGAADSREHKFKREDLTRELGPGPYRGLDVPTRFSEEGRQDAQGPKSAVFKFSASLCQRCNNARSQRHDKAWSLFAQHLIDNRSQILAAEEIDFRAIFGESWRCDALDVGRYIVKHALCRVADNEHDFEVDRGLISFLDGREPPPTLRVGFSIDADLESMQEMLDQARAEAPDAGFFTLGDLGGLLSRSTGIASAPFSHFTYRWLAVHWQLDGEPLDGKLFEPVVRLERTSVGVFAGTGAAFDHARAHPPAE